MVTARLPAADVLKPRPAREGGQARLARRGPGSGPGMLLIDRLEQAAVLDPVVSAGQRVARLIRPAKVRDALHGVWLGHPLHPAITDVPLSPY